MKADIIYNVLFGIVIAAWFAGCKTIRYVPVETIRYIDRHDTVTQTDSIYEYRYVYQTGDTVHDIQYRDRWREKEKIVEVLKIDSVPYPVEVVKEVPRPRSGYDKFTSWAFWLTIVAALVALALWLTDKRYGWWKIVRTALKIL